MDVTTLARRYIDEGLLHDRLPGIHYWQRAGGREAMLVGHRISVADVIETYHGSSNDAEETADYFTLPRWLVDQALDYYVERHEEIDQQLEKKYETAEREEAAWRERQRILAK
jgi:uncharacterized protein (DUF433 family)